MLDFQPELILANLANLAQGGTSSTPWTRVAIGAAIGAVVFPSHRLLAAAAGAVLSLGFPGHAHGPCGCAGASSTPPPTTIATGPRPSGTGGLDDPGALLASSAAARGGVQ